MKRYSETPKKVYICSPLRPRGETEEERKKDLHRNQQLARFACRYATEHGYMPLAPHIYFTQFMDDDDPQDREDGIRYGLKWLEDCEEIWRDEARDRCSPETWYAGETLCDFSAARGTSPERPDR